MISKRFLALGLLISALALPGCGKESHKKEKKAPHSKVYKSKKKEKKNKKGKASKSKRSRSWSKRSEK